MTDDLGGVHSAAPPAQVESAETRAAAECLSLWRAAAARGWGGGGQGPRVEASALARRYGRLARVALPRLPRPALARIQRRPPHSHKEVWLLLEWPCSEPEPTKCFLSDLPEHYPPRRLVRLVKGRWKIAQDYQQTPGGTGARSLRRPPLGRLAPPRHPGHAGACLPDPGEVAEQKNFWVDPATDAP